ncbi:MAG TPA: beta galactosidase jelly roll domain-containing protein, partial [Tichowtungia sp.]|nr:beta galactosidase jelly roll domain-containing protein [Tichowtungia sp.]
MKTLLYSCLLLSLAVPFSALPARINRTVNSGWLFQKGEVDAAGGVKNPDEWTRVNLPHTWNIADVQDEPRGYYRGPGWYAKVLRIPAEWKEKKVYLHFEGANQEATVFLNGKELGHHIGGYTAFRFDLSPHLTFGDENLLTVRVTNKLKDSIPPLSGDFTIYGGIYRNVRLIVTDPVHFDMENDASEG